MAAPLTAHLLGSALLLSHLWLFIRPQLPGFPIGFVIWLLRRVPSLFQRRSGRRWRKRCPWRAIRTPIVVQPVTALRSWQMRIATASWDASKLEVPVSELRRLAKVNHMVGTKPSIARRLLRTLIGFFIAASIGVGATLAWQRHSDETNKVIRNWAVASLDWVSSFSTAKWPPHVDAAAKQSMSDSAQVSAHETALPQTAPVPQTAPSPKSVPISSEVVQQLETAARNLAALQQSIAELAAKQEEMSSNIAKLQAADRENRQKLATARKKVPIAPQQPPSPAPTSSTQTTPPQPSSTQLSSTSSEIRPTPIPRPPSVLR